MQKKMEDELETGIKEGFGLITNMVMSARVWRLVGLHIEPCM